MMGLPLIWVSKALVGLFTIGVCAIFLWHRSKTHEPTKYPFWTLLAIICVGTCIRLFIAFAFYGNFDTASWEIVADIVSRNGNVYAETVRYNYSPLWSHVLGILDSIHTFVPTIPFHAIVRGFLTLVDLATLGILLKIARIENISLITTSLLFYLNPVSFLLTGYHGQIENAAIFFLVLGIWLFKKYGQQSLSYALFWGSLTVGLLTKHIVLPGVIAGIVGLPLRLRVRWMLLIGAATVFFLSFVWYMPEGTEGIIKNVFLYSSLPGYYGITTFFNFPGLSYLFILGFVAYAMLMSESDVIKRILHSVIFFLAFTTGLGNQYFILPVAFAALRPSREFLIYSIVCGIFLLGSNQNIFLPLFRYIPYNVVWVCIIYWFYSLHKHKVQVWTKTPTSR